MHHSNCLLYYASLRRRFEGASKALRRRLRRGVTTTTTTTTTRTYTNSPFEPFASLRFPTKVFRRRLRRYWTPTIMKMTFQRHLPVPLPYMLQIVIPDYGTTSWQGFIYHTVYGDELCDMDVEYWKRLIKSSSSSRNSGDADTDTDADADADADTDTDDDEEQVYCNIRYLIFCPRSLVSSISGRHWKFSGLSDFVGSFEASRRMNWIVVRHNGPFAERTIEVIISDEWNQYNNKAVTSHGSVYSRCQHNTIELLNVNTWERLGVITD